MQFSAIMTAYKDKKTRDIMTAYFDQEEMTTEIGDEIFLVKRDQLTN